MVGSGRETVERVGDEILEKVASECLDEGIMESGKIKIRKEGGISD